MYTWPSTKCCCWKVGDENRKLFSGKDVNPRIDHGVARGSCRHTNAISRKVNILFVDLCCINALGELFFIININSEVPIELV